jgi:hypothetical protein
MSDPLVAMLRNVLGGAERRIDAAQERSLGSEQKARPRPCVVVARFPLLSDQRTWFGRGSKSENDPKPTLGPISFLTPVVRYFSIDVCSKC